MPRDKNAAQHQIAQVSLELIELMEGVKSVPSLHDCLKASRSWQSSKELLVPHLKSNPASSFQGKRPFLLGFFAYAPHQTKSRHSQ